MFFFNELSVINDQGKFIKFLGKNWKFVEVELFSSQTELKFEDECTAHLNDAKQGVVNMHFCPMDCMIAHKSKDSKNKVDLYDLF